MDIVFECYLAYLVEMVGLVEEIGEVHFRVDYEWISMVTD